MKKHLPIGLSDFEKLISENYYFIDKSLFIKEIMDNKTEVTLIPRPRRFGKTLNLSMLQCFFEKTEKSRKYLFDNLEIAKHPEVMQYQGKYPAIFITFKDIKQLTWDSCYDKIKAIYQQRISQTWLFTKLRSFKQYTKKRFYEAIIHKTANQSIYENALKNLSEYLAKFHNQKPYYFN